MLKLPDQDTVFERESSEAIEALKEGLASLVAELDTPVRGPTDLCRALSIDKTLGWKVMRFLEAFEPMAAMARLPGAAGMEIFLRAARRRGLPGDEIELVRHRLNALEELIARHAGDRRTFQKMLAGHARVTGAAGGRTHADLSLRRAAFEGNSYLWGVQAKAQIALRIVRGSDKGEGIDVAAVVGYLDLVRLHPDTSWVVARSAMTGDDGVARPRVRRERIGPAHASTGETGVPVPLLEPFCSSPLPAFRRTLAPDGFMETVLERGPIGETGAVTFFTGEVYRDIASRFRQGHPMADFITQIRTPSELFVDTILVQRGIYKPGPSLGVYSELHADTRNGDLREELRLPVSEELTHRGRFTPSSLRLPEAPRFGELVGWILAQLGWDTEDFETHQVRVPYPVLRSAVVVSFGIPERPS